MTQSEIVSVLCDLHKITGFRVSLHNADFEEIAAYPKDPTAFCAYVHSLPGEFEKCKDCDRCGSKTALQNKSAYAYQCRFGLTEVASPLYSFGILTGFLMMGQVTVGSRSHNNAIRTILPKEDFREKLLASVPSMPEDMLPAYVRILTICAEYLTLSNALGAAHQDLGFMTKSYIKQNFQKKNHPWRHLQASRLLKIHAREHLPENLRHNRERISHRGAPQGGGKASLPQRAFALADCYALRLFGSILFFKSFRGQNGVRPRRLQKEAKH